MDLITLADTLMRHRLAVAIGVVITTALACVGLSQLGFDDNPRAIFRSDDEDFREMERIFEQFGTDDRSSFLVVHSDELFCAESIADLRRLVAEVEQIDGLQSVFSLTDPRLVVFDPLPRPLIPPENTENDTAAFANARAAALKHPLVAGNLLSEDGNHTLVTAELAGDELAISDIQPVHDRLLEIAQRFTATSTLEVHVTGIPSVRVDAFNLVQEESGRFTFLCGLAGFVMAVVILRSWQMVLIVWCTALMGALWTVGALGLLGEQMTVLSVVLPTLVIVVGITDSVHLVVDVRHSRALGLSPQLAARDAVRHLTVACGLTSFTTAVGFASLGVTQTEIVRRFGLACAMGAVLTFVAVITLVPLLASTRLGEGVLPPKSGKRFDAAVSAGGTFLIDVVLRFRWPITIGGVVLSIVLGVVALQLEPENEIAESLPDDAESTRALQLFDAKFGGVLPSFVVVDWPSDVSLSSPELKSALEDVHELCIASPSVEHPFSILNFMQALPGFKIEQLPEEATGNLVRSDLNRAVVVSRSRDLGLAFHADNLPVLEEGLRELERQHRGFRFRLTGSSVLGARNLVQMIFDLTASLGLASVVIFITLTIAFRSIRIGLICLIPNALPLLIAAFLMVWSGESLRFAGVIVFCVCLGIAVDDTIHVVTRFQRELRDVGDVEEALRRSIHAVGSALIITTVVLMVGFSITLTSEIPSNRLFGWLACTAIASALLGDLIVLPAMLACFTKRVGKAES